jgi:hypothetical protein
MDLQNTFYIVAIVFMILHILLLLGIAVTLYVIKRKISEVSATVEERFYLVKEAITNPGQIARGLGAIVANKALEKINSFTQGQKRKSK